MPQIGFARSQAHDALEALLTEIDTGDRQYERWFSADDTRTEAAVYIVPASQYDEMRRGYASWVAAQQVADDDPGLPVGYRPWEHSPLATTERHMPTEPLHDVLAWHMYRKPYSDLTVNRNEIGKDETWQVRLAAVSCLLRVQLDPDGQGAVPILMVGHDPDEPGQALRWRIAHRTKVPGLFTRVTGNGFLGEEWMIITGSGWGVRKGYISREAAEAACEALGRVLPNTDWMRLTPRDFTPPAQKAVLEVLKRYHVWGINEDAPEPGLLADRIPVDPEPGYPGATAMPASSDAAVIAEAEAGSAQ